MQMNEQTLQLAFQRNQQQMQQYGVTSGAMSPRSAMTGAMSPGGRGPPTGAPFADPISSAPPLDHWFYLAPDGVYYGPVQTWRLQKWLSQRKIPVTTRV